MSRGFASISTCNANLTMTDEVELANASALMEALGFRREDNLTLEQRKQQSQQVFGLVKRDKDTQ